MSNNTEYQVIEVGGVDYEFPTTMSDDEIMKAFISGGILDANGGMVEQDNVSTLTQEIMRPSEKARQDIMENGEIPLHTPKSAYNAQKEVSKYKEQKVLESIKNAPRTVLETVEDTLVGVVHGLKKPAAGIEDLLSDIGVPIDEANEWLNENIPFLGKIERGLDDKADIAKKRSPIASSVGEMGGEMALLAAPVSKVGQVGSLASKVGKQAAVGAGLGGATVETESDEVFSEERLKNVGLGGLLGGAGEAVVGGASKVISNIAKPDVDLMTLLRGKESLEKVKGDGSKLTLEGGQLTGGSTIADMASNIPFFGTKGSRVRQSEEAEDVARKLADQSSDKATVIRNDGKVLGDEDIISDSLEAAKRNQKKGIGSIYDEVETTANKRASEKYMEGFGENILTLTKDKDFANNISKEARKSAGLTGDETVSNGMYVRDGKVIGRVADIDKQVNANRMTLLADKMKGAGDINAFKTTNTLEAIEGFKKEQSDWGSLMDDKLVKDMKGIEQILSEGNIDEWEKLKTLRSKVSKLSYEAKRQGKDTTSYSKILSSVEKDMQDTVEGLGDAQLFNRYKQANKQYSDFMDFYNNTPTVKRMMNKEEGRDVFNSLTSNNSAYKGTYNKRFKKMFNELTPPQQKETQNAIESQYFNTALEKAMMGVDEPFNLGSYNKFLRENQQVLDILPKERQDEIKGMIKYLGTLEPAYKTSKADKGLGGLISTGLAGASATANPVIPFVGALMSQGYKNQALQSLLLKLKNAKGDKEVLTITDQITEMLDKSKAIQSAGLSTMYSE